MLYLSIADIFSATFFLPSNFFILVEYMVFNQQTSKFFAKWS
jgi:hypothetical protein